MSQRKTVSDLYEQVEKLQESTEELQENFKELKDNLEPMANMFCKIRKVGWWILAAMITVLLEPKLQMLFKWVST